MKEIQGLIKQNEEMLEKMKEALKPENGHFVEDGLLYRGDIHYDLDGNWKRNPSGQEDTLWESAPLKVMFLTKDYIDDSMDDIRVETGRKNNVSPDQDYIKRDAFTMNIVCWLYGLTHLTTNLSELFLEIKEGSKYFRFYEKYPLLRLNCKKLSGSGRCDKQTLKKHLYYPVYSELLGEQIRLFDANIIICCGGEHFIAEFVEKLYGIDDRQKFEDESLWYDEKHERLIIDTYHPSYSRRSGCTIEDMFMGLMTPYLKFLEANPAFKEKLYGMKVFEENTMEKMPFAVIED